jgi:hypothetical protein
MGICTTTIEGPVCNEKNFFIDCPPTFMCSSCGTPFTTNFPEDSSAKSSNDTIDRPAHYTSGKYEVWDIIDGMGMTDYREANILKYIFRYKHKGGVEDLKKARAYLDRLINSIS